MTRLLTRSDLLAVLDPAACLKALADGFRAAPAAGSRHRADLPFPGTAMVLMPGLLPGIEAYTVKVNAKFPGAVPALRGVICLYSGVDGELLALLDSATLTAWRTGLSAALATHRLSREGGTVGVIGAGAQAELVITGLARLRTWPGLVVQDADPARAVSFAARHGGRTAATPGEVAEAADLVILATWSRQPLLGLENARPGLHFTSLGADEPGKAELADDLLRAAEVIVDDAGLSRASGVLRALPDLPVREFREVMDGPAPAGPLSVYAPVGLPWQDLCLAWLARTEALRTGAGTELDLLA
ncbi:ornithine cyclodeaminase [Actinocorallia longicatena]|uniref:Ornithine cyclodeaminase n=1 Tax=Actinocorallia longicatena TaxID=111803 RepID=A0ABP6QHS6_9ACTN